MMNVSNSDPAAPRDERHKGEQGEQNERRLLRALALAEGFTLALLVFVAVPLKHLAGEPLAVRALGPVHGLVFTAYVWALVRALAAGTLPQGEALRLLGWALVPFGAFLRLRSPARPC